jgi:hypothetical protein
MDRAAVIYAAESKAAHCELPLPLPDRARSIGVSRACATQQQGETLIMGHRDDFYVRDNIIGITGPVNELPSVYFQNAGGEYGHITQVHYYDFNWGRTQVTTDKGWKITNTCPASCGCGQETSHEIGGDGKCFHRSRSKFKALAELTKSELDVVAEAIFRCPFAKTDPGYTALRVEEEKRFQKLWGQRHEKDARGRRGAIDYTGEGLANEVFKIVHPDRA